MPQTSANNHPDSLLNAHCSHGRQHGPTFEGVKRFTALGVTRGEAWAVVRSWRDGRRGELPMVTLATGAAPSGAYFDMTPDDADAMAAALTSAAKMAREVRVLLEAGACK